MIGLEHVFGAVGFAAGVIFASICLTATALWEDYIKDKERRS